MEILRGQPHRLEVTEGEAREIAYHYLRTHLGDGLRPGRLERSPDRSQGEPVWIVDIVTRDSGSRQGELRIGIETGSTCSWRPIS